MQLHKLPKHTEASVEQQVSREHRIEQEKTLKVGLKEVLKTVEHNEQAWNIKVKNNSEAASLIISLLQNAPMKEKTAIQDLLKGMIEEGDAMGFMEISKKSSFIKESIQQWDISEKAKKQVAELLTFRPDIYIIAGASCSGKDTIQKHLHPHTPSNQNVKHIHGEQHKAGFDTDRYYHNRIDNIARGVSIEDALAIDVGRLYKDILSLHEGNPIKNMPTYAIINDMGTRIAEDTSFTPEKSNFIAGIHALYLLALKDDLPIKTCFYINADGETQFKRRILRDSKGGEKPTGQEILGQIEGTIYIPGIVEQFTREVFPKFLLQAQEALRVIKGTYNLVAIHNHFTPKEVEKWDVFLRAQKEEERNVINKGLEEIERLEKDTTKVEKNK